MSTPRDNRIEAMLAVANGDVRPEIRHLSALDKASRIEQVIHLADGTKAVLTPTEDGHFMWVPQLKVHPFILHCMEGPSELPPLTPLPGYHVAEIARGELGEASKIMEEAEEFADAVDQQCSIMALVELADLMGAVKAYLGKHHPSVTIADLLTMDSITERAFQNGYRR